jgi:hypothetical protein
MGSEAINAPLAKAPTFSAWVWYSGTVLLKEGQAVCYNWNYGTATDREGQRFNEVETPTTLNAQFFAGVAARAYPAVSTGQFIEIFLPGSVCNILCGVDTVVGVGLLTFDVTAAYVGQFRYAGLAGDGSAIPVQTTTFDTNPHKVLAKLQVGQPSGGVEVVPLVDNNAIGTLMIGGTTLVTGSTIGAGNCTYTLADGTVPGIRKKFGVITANIVTSDLVITVTSGSTDDIDDVSLDTITFTNGVTFGSVITLSWDGGWMIQGKDKDEPTLHGA